MVLPLPPGGQPFPPLPPELAMLLGMGAPPAPPPFDPPMLFGAPPPQMMPPPPFDPAMLMGPPPPEPEPEPETELVEEDEDLQEAPEPVKPKPTRKKPTSNQVRSMADRAVNFWAERDDRMDEDLDLYQLSRDKLAAEGLGEVVILNIPYSVVEKAAALLGKQKPALDVVVPRNDLRVEGQQVEDYLRHWWDLVETRWSKSGHNSFLRDQGHFLAQRGWLSWRINYDPDSDDAGPLSAPVNLTSYDPREVYPIFGTKGLRYVVHRYWTTIEELLDDWPKAEKLFVNQEDRTEIIEVTGYYDDWWHCVYCDYGDIKPVTGHEYGFVPWVIRVGHGSPVRAARSNTSPSKISSMSSSWTREVGVPIYHGIREVYHQLNRIMSQFATEVAKAADPPLLYTMDPNHPEEPRRLKFDAGSVNYLFHGEDVKPLSASPAPRDYGPLIDALNRGIEMGSLHPQMWGAGAAPSGFSQTLMAEAAEDMLWPLIQALSDAMEEASAHCLELIRDLHTGPVGYFVRHSSSGRWVQGAAVTSELLEETGCVVKITFKSISPRDIAAMSQVAATLTDRKIISLETARDEFLGIDNPGRENERVLTDLIYLDEEIVKALREVAVKRTEPELYAAYTKQMASQPPPAPAAAMPGIPPGLPPGEMPPPSPPGFPPNVIPPIQQSQMTDPNALLLQSLGSAAGGAGMQQPPGVPGIGGLNPPLPLIPGL